jgi:TPR repeat protein
LDCIAGSSERGARFVSHYNSPWARLALVCDLVRKRRRIQGSWEVTLVKSLKGLFGSVSGSDGNEPTLPADVLARAEAGDAEAANELGLWYANNQPGSRMVELWFRRAADAGLPRAQHNMGVLAMRSGQTDDAIGWFRLAAAGGWRDSHFALGSLLEEQGDRKGAFAALESGAQQGCPLSQDAIGRLALEYETEESFKVARYWSEKAAEQNHAEAQTRLGTIFHEGLGVERDPKRAASWFLQAAHQGHAGAQAMIGAALHLGIGVPVDRVNAARWLTVSAYQGNPMAQAYLPRVKAELTPDERLSLEQWIAENKAAN